MIVIGILVPATEGAPATAMVAEIARRAAGTGARTELVGVAPMGPAGDRQLLELAAAGVGHATVTRSAADGIEAADLELALRYLPEIRAVVLVEPAPALLTTAVAASAWSGAALVVVGALDPQAIAVVDAAASRPIVIEPPARDADSAFAGLVAALAGRLDAGEDPSAAWQSTVASLALDRVEPAR